MQSISRLSVIVFILVFKTGHRQFTCSRCPNLNLRQLSESESDDNSTHRYITTLRRLGYALRLTMVQSMLLLLLLVNTKSPLGTQCG